jgi:hypothetical protein
MMVIISCPSDEHHSKTQNPQKLQKSFKNPQCTYKIIHPFSPTPLHPQKKILPVLALLSTAVEKTSKKPHQHPQNGPQKAPPRVLYIDSAPSKVLVYKY